MNNNNIQLRQQLQELEALRNERYSEEQRLQNRIEVMNEMRRKLTLVKTHMRIITTALPPGDTRNNFLNLLATQYANIPEL